VADLNFASLKQDLTRRMDGALEVFHKELGGLRTGRASISLLEPIVVSAYGSDMPINQVGTLGVPEPRLLTVQVWDRGLIKAVEKAIRDANLGLNPMVDGQLVRVPIPPLNEERRVELNKVAKGYAEECRVAIRNVRRHGMDEIKKAEKDHGISTDQHNDFSKQIQALTDAHIKKVDDALANKEKEILQV
jgi:ribosome recycling factor